MSVAQTATKVLEDNKQLLVTAALFEAGRIANNKLTELVGEHLPSPLNLFAQTAFGQVILANVVKMIAEQVRPGDPMIERLTNGMAVAAWTEMIQQLPIEEFLDQILGNRTVASKLKQAEQAEG